MNILISQENFWSELRGWVWRGILCALPSAGWAWMLDFRHPLEVAAILLVVTCFIVAFALGSTWIVMKTTTVWLRFLRALKIAAGIKILSSLVLLIWPDMLLGLCSVELVGLMRGVRESTDIARLDSFLLTGLTTLIQGALLSVLLVLIALAVLCVQGALRWAKRRQFSPTSI